MTKTEKKFISRFLGKYKLRYAVYLLIVLLATFFSVCSIVSLNNFLQILFYDTPQTVQSSSLLDDFLNKIYSWFLVFGKQKALIYFTFLILVVYFLKDLFSWVGQYHAGITRNNIIRDIRNALFEKYTTQDVSYINKFKKGDLLARFSADITEFDETVLKSYQTIINSATTVLLYVAALFYIDTVLTLIALLLFPLVAGLTSVLSGKLRRSSRKLQDGLAYLVSMTEEAITGLRIIKSMTAIDRMNEKFRAFNKDYVKLRNKIYRKVDLASPQSEFFASIVIGFLLLAGCYRVLNTSVLSAPMFIVYLLLFILIIKPAKDTSTAVYSLKRGTASLNRIMEVINSQNTVKEPEISADFPQLKDGIIFKNVCFAYQDGVPVLKNVNIVFKKNQTTAIVGNSGSGKSTVINLIEKFWQLPEKSGDILFDDVSINSLFASEIRNNISLVTQDTVLINDTVKNNIAFGENYSDEQIKAAADIANATEFINLLPQGFDTNIGDKGKLLSGGQQQRISIARAVLKNSQILILDEVTSALDTESERKVQQALDIVSKDKTVIMIAHRLSTIVNADKIIVLQDGEVKEEGTHKRLYDKQGIYYNMCLAQHI